MKFVAGKIREKPLENPTQTAFRPIGNSHVVTESRIWDPSDGRRV